jgi:hypothetical protein
MRTPFRAWGERRYFGQMLTQRLHEDSAAGAPFGRSEISCESGREGSRRVRPRSNYRREFQNSSKILAQCEAEPVALSQEISRAEDDHGAKGETEGANAAGAARQTSIGA